MYKGMTTDMRGTTDDVFEVGRTYVYDGQPVVGDAGYHCCSIPLSTFRFFAPNDSIYCEVEAKAPWDASHSEGHHGGDTISAKEITIKKALTIKEVVEHTYDTLMWESDIRIKAMHCSADITFHEFAKSDPSYADIAVAAAYYSMADSINVAITCGDYSIARSRWVAVAAENNSIAMLDDTTHEDCPGLALAVASGSHAYLSTPGIGITMEDNTTITVDAPSSIAIPMGLAKMKREFGLVILTDPGATIQWCGHPFDVVFPAFWVSNNGGWYMCHVEDEHSPDIIDMQDIISLWKEQNETRS